jgi:hypothetical protein
MSPTRILGLCLIVGLSLAILASQAQATSKWMTPPTGEPLPGEPAEVSGKVEKALALLSTSGSSTVEITCEGLAIEDGLLEAEGKISATGSFKGCTTLLNGVTSKRCVPRSPAAAGGTIVTNRLKGLLVLHTLEGGASEALIELLPQSGTKLVSLEFGEGLCALPPLTDITGTLFVRDSNGELEVEAESHLLEASPALGGVLFGGNPATLDGAVRVSLVKPGLWNGLAK